MCQIDVNIVKSVCCTLTSPTSSCYLRQMGFILTLQQFLNGKLGTHIVSHNYKLQKRKK